MVAPYKVIAVELILVMGALVIGGIARGIIPENTASGVVLGTLAVLGAVVLINPVPTKAEVKL